MLPSIQWPAGPVSRHNNNNIIIHKFRQISTGKRLISFSCTCEKVTGHRLTGVLWGTRAAVRWYSSYFLEEELFHWFKELIRGQAKSAVSKLFLHFLLKIKKQTNKQTGEGPSIGQRSLSYSPCHGFRRYLESRKARETLLWLYENVMSNNFLRTADLKKNKICKLKLHS